MKNQRSFYLALVFIGLVLVAASMFTAPNPTGLAVEPLPFGDPADPEYLGSDVAVVVDDSFTDATQLTCNCGDMSDLSFLVPQGTTCATACNDLGLPA